MIESNKEYATRKGYEVHHDIGGWYVVAPREQHVDGFDPKTGANLGFDGRQKFPVEDKAWEVAAIRAKRAGTRESRKGRQDR